MELKRICQVFHSVDRLPELRPFGDRRAGRRAIVGAIIIGAALVLLENDSLAQVQETDPIVQLHTHLLTSNLGAVLLKSAQLLVAAIASVLLFRVAEVKEDARFLQHVSFAYGIACIGGAMSIGAAFFVDHVALQALIPMPGATPSMAPGAALDAIKKVHLTADALDISLSLCSTFAMFLGWDLLYRYPEQGIPKEVFASAAGALGVIVTIIIGLAAVYQEVAIPYIEIVDTMLSVIVTVFVGWELRRIVPGHEDRPLPIAARLAFVAWASAQTVYWVSWTAEERTIYSLVLFLLGFGAAVLLVVLSSLYLRDKEKYAAS